MPGRYSLNRTIEDLKRQLEDLEKKITAEIQKNSEAFQYTFLRNKPFFSREVRSKYRDYVQNPIWYILQSPISFILTSPFIYILILPAILTDFLVTIYQHINFRIYGIPIVRRSDYVIIDRHKLPYLNIIEKFHCVYCSYFNGVLSYSGEVAARTEQFWCPIRHARPDAPRHSRTYQFADYGDATYHEKLAIIRQELKNLENEAVVGKEISTSHSQGAAVKKKRTQQRKK
jgi:hypothetical protein